MPRKSNKKSKKRPKAKAKPRAPQKPRVGYPAQPVQRYNLAPAAVSVGWNAKMGLPDLRMKVSWQMGTIYVGNGTLGATGSVYFRNLAGSIYVSGVPVPFNDSTTYLVPSYLTDVTKHFARLAVNRLRLRAVPIVSSTANSATIFIAPIRGGQFYSAVPVNDTTASLSVSQMMTMKGVVGGAVYEEFGLDLTPYLAGGSGAKQNEVAVANEEFTSSTTVGADAQVLCGITIGGNVVTTTLSGYNTHYLLVDAELSLLDFVGGVVDATGFGDQPKMVAYRKGGVHSVDEKGVFTPLVKPQPKRVTYARAMSGVYPTSQGQNTCVLSGTGDEFQLYLGQNNQFLDGSMELIDTLGTHRVIQFTNAQWSQTGVMTITTAGGQVVAYVDPNSWNFVGSGILTVGTLFFSGSWNPSTKQVLATYTLTPAAQAGQSTAPSTLQATSPSAASSAKLEEGKEVKSLPSVATPQRTGWFVV